MEGRYSVPLNRRSYNRFRVDSPATLIINENIEKPIMLKDISCRGAGGVIEYPIKVNDRVGININASSFKKPIYRKAKISWCKKIDNSYWEAGLDFGLNSLIEFS